MRMPTRVDRHKLMSELDWYNCQSSNRKSMSGDDEESVALIRFAESSKFLAQFIFCEARKNRRN